jgi:hypothetical protein
MFNKTKIALATAVVLGAASAALAESDRENNEGGYQTQTWQSIAQARQDVQRQIQSQYNLGNGREAFGYVGPSHKRTHVRQDVR